MGDTTKSWFYATFGGGDTPSLAEQRNELFARLGRVEGDCPIYARRSTINMLSDLRRDLVAASTQQQITAAEKAIEDAKKRFASEAGIAREKRKSRLALCEEFSKHATEGSELAEELKQAREVIADDPAKANDLYLADQHLAKAKMLVEIPKKISPLSGDCRGAALTALDALEKAINGVTVTQQMVNKAYNDRKQPDQEAARLLKALEEAQKLPDTTEGKAEQIKQAEVSHQEAASKAADAKKLWEQRRGERDRQVDQQKDAIAGRKSLFEAISYGPLSPQAGRPFKPETTKKLIAAYGKDPRLATVAVGAAATAPFPDAIANRFEVIAESVRLEATRKRDGHSAVANPRKYGEDLLKMGGQLGDDYFAGSLEYLRSERHREANPLGDAGMTAGTVNARAQKRSIAVADKLLRPDGTLDLNSDAAQQAVGDALYHPDAVTSQLTSFNAMMVKTVKELRSNEAAANGVLRGIADPAGDVAKGLVRQATGKADQVDAGDARKAVLATMLKSFDQGNVGSCFATGPARRQRQAQPIEAMKSYAEIASKGTFTPGSGDSVPTVTTIAAGEDPIMRSYEYSLANATSVAQDSNERERFAGYVAKGSSVLTGETGLFSRLGGPSQKQKKLNADLAAACSFVYDPTVDTKLARDGSSSKGRFVLKISGIEIRDKEQFCQAIKPVAQTSLEITDGSEEATRLEGRLGSDDFINAVCGDNYKPWELPSGGFGHMVTATLKPRGQQQTKETELLSELPTSVLSIFSKDEGDRMTSMLGKILTAFGNGSDAMVPVGTSGMHDFNVLPHHPSLDPLQGTDEKSIQKKLETALSKPGEALRDTVLEADRAAWMYDQEVARAVKDEPTEQDMVGEIAEDKRPKVKMKPADVVKAIDETLREIYAARAKKRAKTWEQEEGAKRQGDNPVKPEEVQKKEQSLKEEFARSAEAAAKARMIREMGAPQFVFADTNWGDATNHTFFVIAPDPTTGKPLLWQRDDPPGTLTLPGADWPKAEWGCYQ